MRVEFDSFAQAVAAHDSPAYQAALAALGMGPSATTGSSKASAVECASVGRRFPPPWTVEELTKVAAQKTVR